MAYVHSKEPYPESQHPEAMGRDEIRRWIKELYYNEDYGWANKRGGKAELSRILGYDTTSHLLKKMEGGWIFPSEQIRMGVRIREILSGKLKPESVSAAKVRAVVVDVPTPVKRGIINGRVKVGKGGMTMQLERLDAKPSVMPSFKRAIENLKG